MKNKRFILLYSPGADKRVFKLFVKKQALKTYLISQGLAIEKSEIWDIETLKTLKPVIKNGKLSLEEIPSNQKLLKTVQKEHYKSTSQLYYERFRKTIVSKIFIIILLILCFIFIV